MTSEEVIEIYKRKAAFEEKLKKACKRYLQSNVWGWYACDGGEVKKKNNDEYVVVIGYKEYDNVKKYDTVDLKKFVDRWMSD